MPNRDLRRRSYGFISRPQARSVRAQGGKKKAQPTPKGKKLSKIDYKKRLKWLALPFQLLFFLLKSIWQLINWFWQKRPKLKKRTKQELKRRILWIALTVVVLGFLSFTIMVAWASKDLPDPDKLTDRQVAQSTKIYDRTGEHLLYEIFAKEKRTLVELEDIPQHLIDGVIATEDKDFYQHKGIRLRSFVRAIVYGVFSRKRIGGTSTLTQQLVKNAILTSERRISRKIKEVILSIRLEQKYSKEQILKIYFNEIPYGSTNYGAQSAAQSYFGKPVSELDLQEAATLAALPKAPTYYLNNSEALKQRRDFVLRRMHEEGFITEQEKEDAQSQPLTLEKHYGDIRAPHFVLYVKEQLVGKYGEQKVDTGGLKVITTLDWEKQEIAERAVEEAEDVFAEAQANNAALVAIDPKNGHILSLVGSRDFANEEIDGQFNVATLGRRQPGSSFKPIIYTAAFEKGYTPDTVLFDVITNFAASGKKYEPKNYDLQERGPVTMRQALQGSLNIPAVKTLYLVGPEKGVEFAERLGYTTLSKGQFGLSLVLGGGEVKLLDHVNAYAVFAGHGVRHEPVSILKVEDQDGEILQEWKKKRGEKVLEEEITATITNVLSDDGARAYAFGAGGVLTLPGRPVAAKTGTTNDYRDAWTIGYTPSLAAGVWVGNTDNTALKRGYGGSKAAGPIWKKFMTEALEDSPVEGFPAAPANDAEKPILRGSQGGGITLLVDKVTNKLATSSTPEKYITERTYLPGHSLLHYVNKDDPRGPAPEDPAQDPQYEIWEAAIQDWVKREKEENPDWEISFADPPTEYDTIHSLELIPSLEVVYPTDGATLYSRQINTDIRVSAPRGVAKVMYKIDDRYVGTVKEHPFNLNYYARDFENGEHILTIMVEDDVGNRLEHEVKFNLQAGEEAPAITWATGSQALQQKDFPRIFLLNHFKLDKIAELRIYRKKEGGEKNIVFMTSNFDDLFNNQIIFKWEEAPEKGEWELIAEIKLKDGSVGKIDRVSVIAE